MTSKLIEYYGEKLDSILDKVDQQYKYNQIDFNTLIQVFNFVRKECKKIQSLKGLKEAILIAGNTGAGKSTLLNYLLRKKLYITDDYRLRTDQKTEIQIGDGSGSTTLLPNLIQNKIGNFLDLAGDFQTRGTIGQIFNNLWKSQLDLHSFKLVLVVPADNFGPNGSYGKMFKQMIQKNSRLLGDINSLKEHTVMVVSFAERIDKALDCIIKSLKNCMKHKDGSLKPYLQFLNYLIDNNKILTFSKPQNSHSGDQYLAPAHNQNQRQNISSAISNSSFKKKQTKFQVTSDPFLRENLQKALLVLSNSIINKIDNSIKSIRKIHGIQAKKTYKIIQQLKLNNRINFEDKNWNQFLKNIINKNQLWSWEQINQDLTENIKFIIEFLKYDQKQVIQNVKIMSDDSKQYLSKISKQIIDVLALPGQNFRKLQNRQRIKVSPILNNYMLINQQFKKLKSLYQKKVEIVSNKTNTTSQFYENQYYQQYLRTDQQPYQQLQPYTQTTTKYKTINYDDYEEYDTTEKDYKWESYKDYQYYQVPIEKTRKKTKTIRVQQQYEEVMPITTGILHVASLGILTIGKVLFTGNPWWSKTETRWVDKQISYNETYIQYEQRKRSVTKKRKISYNKPVTKYKRVSRTKKEPYQHSEIKYRNITKYRDKPIYQTRIRRKFKQYKYDIQFNSIQSQITSKIIQIRIKLNKQLLGNNRITYTSEQIQQNEKGLPEQYKQLIKRWELAEIKCYSKKYQNNQL